MKDDSSPVEIARPQATFHIPVPRQGAFTFLCGWIKNPYATVSIEYAPRIPEELICPKCLERMISLRGCKSCSFTCFPFDMPAERGGFSDSRGNGRLLYRIRRPDGSDASSRRQRHPTGGGSRSPRTTAGCSRLPCRPVTSLAR